MTEFAIVKDGKLVEVVSDGRGYTDADGTKHPPNIWDLWSADELKEKLGAVAITPAEIPAGKQQAAPRTLALELDELTGNASVREVVVLEDAPPPPPAPKPLADDCSMAELLTRLRAIGLTL